MDSEAFCLRDLSTSPNRKDVNASDRLEPDSVEPTRRPAFSVRCPADVHGVLPLPKRIDTILAPDVSFVPSLEALPLRVDPMPLASLDVPLTLPFIRARELLSPAPPHQDFRGQLAELPQLGFDLVTIEHVGATRPVPPNRAPEPRRPSVEQLSEFLFESGG
jgi:hypothetical protein